MSLEHYAYGIHRSTWKQIKQEAYEGTDSKAIAEKYDLDKVQVWFLFDKLLRGELNSLYKRSPLTEDDVRIGQYVYCDYPEFGKGEVVAIFNRDREEFPNSAKLMSVKFETRKYSTMCDYEKFVTVHDDIKRKLTQL